MKQLKSLYFIVLFIYIVVACDKQPDESIVQKLPLYYEEYLDRKASEIITTIDLMEECEAVRVHKSAWRYRCFKIPLPKN